MRRSDRTPVDEAFVKPLESTLQPLDEARQLPPASFLDASIFEQEQLQLFRHAWRFVGALSEWSDARVVVRSWPDASVVVTRYEGSLHGFANVCRHRGARLLPDGAHDIGLIRCPYHAWGYGCDGSLQYAPHTDLMLDFDRDEFGLHPVGIEQLGGLVFASVGCDAEPVHLGLATVTEVLERYRLDETRMIAEQRYDVKANWKVVAQNYLECYHCPSAHPTLCRAIEWGKGDRLIASDKAIGGYMDLCEGSETASVGGSITGRRLLGEQRPEDLRRVYSFFLFPNIIISLHPDYLLMYEFAALAPNLTTVSCEFWAVPESGADHCDVVDFWDQTLREDWTLCESVQRGIGEPSYQPGPYTLLERDVHAFDRWVARHHLAWQ